MNTKKKVVKRDTSLSKVKNEIVAVVLLHKSIGIPTLEEIGPAVVKLWDQYIKEKNNAQTS